MNRPKPFKTFYFKTGFESLEPLVNCLEDQFNIDIAIGSDFINVYTKKPELLKEIEQTIHAWSALAPHVQLDPKEHK